MIPCLQRSLPLQIHQRTALVTLDMARAALGLDADSVLAMIDAGEIRWAWNISACDGRREIRIWARDLIARQAGLQSSARLYSHSEVIDSVIGSQLERLSSVQVSTHILLCSRPHMLDLLGKCQLTGDLVGHTQWIHRSSLVQFLQNRLL